MTARPVFEPDPDEILRVLPTEYRPQFLAAYDAAVTATRKPEEHRHLREFLRTWRHGTIITTMTVSSDLCCLYRVVAWSAPEAAVQ